MNRVRQGDQVEIISGNERGFRGKVRVVFPKQNRVIVEGLNIVKKHQRPTPTAGRTPVQAGIIELEAPLDLSNVAPVCQSCDEWTRVGFEGTPDGGKVRVCKRCDAHMD
ncbi:MAG: 50S ribosomal protein L24 [Anaerolineae bacterium]